MDWVKQIQRYVALTAAEASAVLSLLGLLFLGIGIRYFQAELAPVPFYPDASATATGLVSAVEEPQPAFPSTTEAQDSSFPIDLNAAAAAELEQLPGIGPKLAAAIVADRETNGPYTRVDDIVRVKGIGPKTLARFDSLVVVRKFR